MKKELQLAEYKARKADERVVNGGLTETELNDRVMAATEIINEIEEVTGKSVSLHNVKKFPKVKFAQIIQINVHFLVENNYLTTGEKAFLFDVSMLVGFKTNAIVHTENNVQVALSQQDIADKLNMSKRNVVRVINTLIDKGVMSRSETVKDGVNSRTYMYFMNPNIIFNGDKNNVEETLKLLFSVANKKTLLKDLPYKFV